MSKEDRGFKSKDLDEKELEHLSEEERKELSVEEQRELDLKRQQELGEQERADVVISPLQLVWQNFKSRKITLIGVGLFAFILFFVFIIPIFQPAPEVNPALRYTAPNLTNWMGTDAVGRDVFARATRGGQVSLFVGFIATLISTVIGVLIGSISGFYSGVIDNILQRITEVVRSFPFLPLIITLSAALGSDTTENMRLFIVMVILGFVGWTGLARLLRGQILSIREQEFILAAKAVGIKDFNIIIKHIIPNVVSIIIVSATLSFAANILVESGLSFLGFGVQEPGASWGLLLRQGTQNSSVIQNQPWMWFFPGMLILLTVLSVNFIGDGLRDAIDPKNNAR